jgi:hypothetical protein
LTPRRSLLRLIALLGCVALPHTQVAKAATSPDAVPPGRQAEPAEKDRALEYALMVNADAATIDQLLKQGANPSARVLRPGNFQRATFLAVAIFHRRWDVASLLVGAGASLTDCPEQSPDAQCRFEPKRSLLPDSLPLISAMWLGAPLDLLQLMVRKGVDVNAQDSRGRTALDFVEGNCLRQGQWMTGVRCTAETDPPSNLDAKKMEEFLRESGAVPRPIARVKLALSENRGTGATGSGHRASAGSKIAGRVVDAQTKQPIEGAVVVANWTSTSPAGPESREGCDHSDAAVTGSDGAFAMDAWSGFWSPRLWGVFDRKVTFTVYKRDYVLPESTTPNIELVRVDRSVNRLVSFGDWPMGLSCFRSGILLSKMAQAEFRKTRKHFYWLYSAVAVDWEPLAETAAQRRAVRNLWFEAESSLTDYSKPIMTGRNNLDINIDPNNSLKPDDLADR